jgi:ribosomal protein S18 acetylase RimI-like enzyme
MLAAPCAPWHCVRGPVRIGSCGRPLNEIVRRHLDHAIVNANRAELCAVDEVAVSAFREFQHHYSDWATFSRNRSPMTSLADSAAIVVAKVRDEIAGAVAYIGPNQPKGQLFDDEWAIMRMLVVAPPFRGRGIGHALAVECLQRAVADGAAIMGLHTSKIMTIALPMYERLGFRFERDVAPIYGVPYAVYVKQLTANDV